MEHRIHHLKLKVWGERKLKDEGNYYCNKEPLGDYHLVVPSSQSVKIAATCLVNMSVVCHLVVGTSTILQFE